MSQCNDSNGTGFGFRRRRGGDMLLFRSESQHRIMGQPILLLNEYKVKLTTLLHLAPRLTIIGAKMLLILMSFLYPLIHFYPKV